MRRLTFGLLVAFGLSGAGCGAPAEVVSAPVASAPAKVKPRPAASAKPMASASASAMASASVVEEAPEEPLLDPVAPLPAGAVARLGTTRMRFRAQTIDAAFTAAGAPVILENVDGLAARDLMTDRVLLRPSFGGGGGYGATVAIAADASFVVTAHTRDKAAEVALQAPGEKDARWTVKVKSPLVKQTFAKKTTMVPARVDQLVPSPNGSHVAVVFSSGDVTVLAAKDGAVTGRFSAGKARLEALSRDGKVGLLVDDGTSSSGLDALSSFGMLGLLGGGGARVKVVQVVDTKNGAVLRKLEPNVVAKVAMTPNGAEILALWAGSLIAVNVATGARRVVSDDVSPSAGADRWLSPAPSMNVSPDGSRVAISEATTDVVRLSDGSKIEQGLEGTLVCFSADGALLLMREADIARVVGRATEVPEGHEAGVTALAFAAGGRVLVSSADDVRFWNPRSGRQRSIAPSAKAQVLASDPAGEHLVIGAPELLAAKVDGSLIALAVAESGAGSGSGSGKPRLVEATQAAPLPGGAGVAVITGSAYSSSGPSERVRLWSMTGAAEIAKTEVASPVRIAAGPDGDRIAVLSRDSKSKVHVLDAKSLEVVRTFEVDGWSDGFVGFVGNDSRLVAGAGWRSGMMLFDVDRGEPLKRFHGGACCSVGATSRDGRFVAGATGRSVLLWQVEPRKLVSVFQGHKAAVKALAFSPDGALLASGSEDTSVLVWDTTASVMPAWAASVTRVPGASSMRLVSTGEWALLAAESTAPAGKPGAAATPTGRVRTVLLERTGSTRVIDVPGTVPGITQLVGVGSARCALDGKGDVRCWGWPYDGALGTGPVPRPKGKAPRKSVDVPQLVKLPGKARELVGGSSYMCAVLTDGRLTCWGSLLSSPDAKIPGSQALVDALPAEVSGPSNVVAVGVGGGFACALEKAGGVMCWGKNDEGQLGTAHGEGSAVPVDVPGIRDARALSVGGSHACVLDAVGAITCWGSDERNQLPAGTGITTRDARTFGKGFTEVTAGRSATCAREAGGDVVCWGMLGAAVDLPWISATKVPEATGLTQLRIAPGMLCGERSGGEVVCVRPAELSL